MFLLNYFFSSLTSFAFLLDFYLQIQTKILCLVLVKYICWILCFNFNTNASLFSLYIYLKKEKKKKNFFFY